MENHDVVYFVKESESNEELRYSLRSLKNFPHRNVWFFGGCPKGLKPDRHENVNQFGDTKWAKVGGMIAQACNTKALSEDFWLFNDDFFVMRPVDNMPQYHYGTLEALIERIEANHHGPSAYTRRLEKTIEMLKELGLETTNYELHVPILINKKKMLEMYAQGIRGASRSLYGNLYKIGGEERKDVKIFSVAVTPNKDVDFLSTTDISFERGKVGEYIRQQFPDKSKFEE